MAQGGQEENDIGTWLEQMGLVKYAPLLRAIGYRQLAEISGLTPEEFKDSLKQAFVDDIDLAGKIGFSKVSAPDLGRFGHAVIKLNRQAKGV